VVCSTFRRPHLLPRLVAALEAQTLPADDFVVSIVDNGSGDGTSAELERLAASTSIRLEPLALEVNAGPAGARNRGWQVGDEPLVAFVDDDCVPDPGWLAAGIAALTADPRCGVVQGPVRPPPGAVVGAWTVLREHDAPTPWFEGCNVFYRREALAAAGGFAESIGWYGEDTELGWSVLDGGWTRGFAADAGVQHDVEERGLRWQLRNAYLERNLIGVGVRHHGFRRDAYWRRWIWAPAPAAVTLGGIGVLLAALLWWWPPLVLVLPWCWLRLPRRGYKSMPMLGPQRLAVDAARAAGHLVGSVRHRTLVL
jgi:GT2 family glycosyltransferase